MARVQHPTNGTVVSLEGNLLERYRALGWAEPSALQVPVLLEKPEEVVAPIVGQNESEPADLADAQEAPAGEVPAESVDAVETVEIEAPRGNASLKDWAAYAMSKGVAGETLNGLKQSEIRALFAEK